MKFETSEFWKHDRCMDAFLRVRHELPKPDGSILLIADWMTQGTEDYWLGMPGSQFLIEKDDIERWHPYIPKGKLK